MPCHNVSALNCWLRCSDERLALTLERALGLAAKWHEGQLYGDGPYILHPLRVMMAVPEEYRVVAILHDVLEDTEIPLSVLSAELEPTELEALGLLTRTTETYSAYIERLAQAAAPVGPVVRRVKCADLEDHLDNPSEQPRLQSLGKRYRKALARLNWGETPEDSL